MMIIWSVLIKMVDNEKLAGTLNCKKAVFCSKVWSQKSAAVPCETHVYKCGRSVIETGK